ncbi:MAG: hypothetical protein ABSF54_05285 [Bryobacteraceae bacterium]
MTKKIKLIPASAAAIAGLVALSACGSNSYPDRLGAAESWSPYFPLSKNAQVEMLETGLDDVRGLACDREGNFFLAEANGRVLKYSAGDKQKGEGKFSEADPTPDEPQKIDQRGVVVGANSMLIAEHGRGRIAMRDKSVKAVPERDILVAAGRIAGPSGIAAFADTLFITDDHPWPGPGEDPAFDSADYTRWIDKGSQRLFGAVYACRKFACNADGCQCTPELLVSRLRHPSGIAAEGPDGPLYVAESDSAEVRWAILEKNNEHWIRAGSLGSAPTAGQALPPFMGVAVDDAHCHIFAAGPNSLYVLSRPRGMLGRIVFEDAVTGVAYYAGSVYLVVGHRLCRIKLDKDGECASGVRR